MQDLEFSVRDTAFEICKSFLGGVWKECKSWSIEIRKLEGGYINNLFYCSLPDTKKSVGNEPTEAVLRIFGSRRENKLDIINETTVFISLAEKGLGPQLYGVFPGGRLEEFIPGRCLTYYEATKPDVYIAVAKRLAKIHSLRPPLKKDPSAIYDLVNRYAVIGKSEFKPENWTERERENAKFVFSHNIEKETNWLRDLFKTLDLPQVFSHNDARGANIILRNKNKILEDEIYFVDVEFAAYNYRGFDFASYFTQWCVDFSLTEYPYFTYSDENYPTKEEQVLFIRSYLESLNNNDDKNAHINSEEHILKEIEVLLLGVHLWSTLRIIGFSGPKQKLGSWEYAKIKLQLYFKEKEKVLKKIKKGLL